MGKKIRDERREIREDYASSRSKNNRKTNLMAAGILALIALIVGYASYEFITMDVDIPGAPPGAGVLGGEHEHASLLVRIFGDKFAVLLIQVIKLKVVGFTLKKVMVLQFIDTHQE